jgi:hypothetical protein
VGDVGGASVTSDTTADSADEIHCFDEKEMATGFSPAISVVTTALDVPSQPRLAPGRLKPPVRRSRFDIVLEDEDDDEYYDEEEDEEEEREEDNRGELSEPSSLKSRGRSRCVRPMIKLA